MYLQQALELFKDPMTFISCRIEHGNRGMMTMKVGWPIFVPPYGIMFSCGRLVLTPVFCCSMCIMWSPIGILLSDHDETSKGNSTLARRE
jgi:hypothetical protein